MKFLVANVLLGCWLSSLPVSVNPTAAWPFDASGVESRRHRTASARCPFPAQRYIPAAIRQERTILPRDDADKNPSFREFRKKLIEAGKQKNLNHLLSIASPDINYSFGDDGGLKGFEEYWDLTNPESEFWDKFIFVLEHGGVLEKIEGKQFFSAPYYFALFPADLDPFELEVVISKDAALREKPETASRELSRLSYNIVKVDHGKSIPLGDPDEFKYSWLKVTSLGGKSGFIEARHVRPPLGYRAIFEQQAGKWVLTAFIAGD